MTTQPRYVSITVPVGQAIDRVKQVLFQPLDLGKWFIIGFCAWLALLGQGGAGGGGTGFHAGPSGNAGGLHRSLDEAKDYILSNLYWLAPLVVAIVVVCLAVWVLLMWLSSRGQFMFLHCVALNKAEVTVPWSIFAREANSLFRFRLVLALIGLVLTVPLVSTAAILGYQMIARETFILVNIFGLIGIGFGLMLAWCGFWVIGKFTRDFVVPIMFRHNTACMLGWRRLWSLVTANVGWFILYLIFQVVLWLLTCLLLLVVIVATCCICGCLMIIPYLGTVLILPILVFHRSYSLYFLAQFGPEFDVFPAPAEP